MKTDDYIKEIYVPVKPILLNYNGIVQKLFDGSSLHNARTNYLSDPTDNYLALTYEREIYKALGLKTTFSEIQRKLREDSHLTEKAAISSAAYFIERAIEKVILPVFSRRLALKLVASSAAAFLIHQLTGGATSVAEHVIANDMEEELVKYTSSAKARFIVIDGVERSLNPNEELSRIADRINANLSTEFASPGNISYNAPVTDLVPDVNSEEYKRWKSALRI